MTRHAISCSAALLVLSSAAALAQTPTPAPAPVTRRSFEKFTEEGKPVDRRKPELDTDHPVFPGQTGAPYHKTVDVQVTTIASGLDVPWAMELLPSGRYLVTEKVGRLRILDKDGSTLHTITAGMPPVYFRGQAGLLDVALDKDFATNHRIFYVYLRDLDADNCAHAVDSAVLDETAGTISTVTTIFQARKPSFTSRLSQYLSGNLQQLTVMVTVSFSPPSSRTTTSSSRRRKKTLASSSFSLDLWISRQRIRQSPIPAILIKRLFLSA